MSQHQVSPEMWISAYLHTGISRLEIKKKTRSTKSRITDENRERLYFLYFLMIPLFLLMLETLGV
jgi:hypothetical protein